VDTGVLCVWCAIPGQLFHTIPSYSVQCPCFIETPPSYTDTSLQGSVSLEVHPGSTATTHKDCGHEVAHKVGESPKVVKVQSLQVGTRYGHGATYKVGRVEEIENVKAHKDDTIANGRGKSVIKANQ
jgi:hypothetical protein